MIRKAETIIGLVGGILSLLIFGAFSATILMADLSSFEETLYTALPESEMFSSPEQAFELMRQFSIWMGIFLFLMIVGLAFATVFIFKNGKPRLAGVLYIITAVLLLIGTQGIGFPIAFLFLICAYLSFFRKPSPNPKKKM